MKHKTPQLLQAHLDGLQRYLIDVPHRCLGEAHQLAERALTKGLETLDLAKIHEGSNLALKVEIEHREAVESSHGISKSTTSDLLEESLHLQEKLRLLSSRLLIAWEKPLITPVRLP